MDISNTKELNNKFIFWRHEDKPTLFMLVGLPGCGKSTVADKIYAENAEGKIEKPIVHSSDALREELLGDVNAQDQNEKIFRELHKRIKNDLQEGKNVIYDATNINKKMRAAFLSELRKIPTYKQCLCVITPYDVCIQFNRERERNIPEYVIRKMYMTWTPPDCHEGFNSVLPVYNYGNIEKKQEYTLQHLFKEMDPFDQENSHHDYTLGMHCREAAKYVVSKYPNDSRLKIATLLHDNGKVFTKTNKNANGEIDNQCHYYQHQCVGAYNSMFYTDIMGMNYEDQFAIANLIYYHMHPHMSWSQSEKAMKRDIKLIGDDTYQQIMKLHEADVAAHGERQQEQEMTEGITQEDGGFEIER